jgi:S-adenosylmethionine/arginine decarboxylase-like enzyme
MSEEKQMWGWHLIIDAAACDKDAIADRQHIEAFLKELVSAIDMVPYGDPWIEHFAGHCEEKAGFTVFRPIETSAIVMHNVNANGSVFFDAFSCKPFERETVLEVFQKYFKPQKVSHMMIERAAPDLD